MSVGRLAGRDSCLVRKCSLKEPDVNELERKLSLKLEPEVPRGEVPKKLQLEVSGSDAMLRRLKLAVDSLPRDVVRSRLLRSVCSKLARSLRSKLERSLRSKLARSPRSKEDALQWLAWG